MLGKRPEGQWVMAEFDRYAKMADQLRKNHASGPLDDKAVRDLLRRLGVASAPRPRRDAPPPPPAKPFPVPVYTGGYRWPLDAGLVTSEYGQRRGTPHQGMDIAAELRVPVYAVAEGEAIYVGDQLGGYGNVVILRHDQKTTTLYAHNSALKIKTGQKVKSDQVVALLGSTGRSTGPHLHFEMRENERPVNPRPYLPKSRF
ncbi:MAG TPA: M23 family metallopeptidase [Methylomirabilota bacterium]|jgi:murein DD-endopeptidase MepM/ murein hydrolase activator NlpD